MARFVMANRRAGKFLDDEKRASRAALAASFDQLFAANVNVIADRDPQDALARRVVLFDADPEGGVTQSGGIASRRHCRTRDPALPPCANA